MPTSLVSVLAENCWKHNIYIALNYNYYAERVKTETYFFSSFFSSVHFCGICKVQLNLSFCASNYRNAAHTMHIAHRHDERCKLMNGKQCKRVHILCFNTAEYNTELRHNWVYAHAHTHKWIKTTDKDRTKFLKVH